MKSTRLLTQLGIAITSCTLLSGCLLSKQPLFPSGRIVAQTPLEPGWYFKSIVESSKGDSGKGVAYEPVYLARNGKTYETYINEGKKPEYIFQLFSSSSDSEVMIAQAYLDEKLWGYQRIDIGKNVFMSTEHSCNHSGGNMNPAYFPSAKENGMRTEKTSCYFNDAVTLSGIATLGGAWPTADRHGYERISDRKLISLRRMKDGPKTLDQCEGGYATASMDASLGEPSIREGVRRHVFALSSNLAIAAETRGNEMGKWGYIMGREGDGGSRIYCKPRYTIKLDAILPKESVYIIKMPAQRIAERCARTSNDACGTLDDMIARIGGQILLQGADVVNLPRGEQAIGPFLTVMGTRGTGVITILKSESDGMTRILKRDE